MSAKNSTASIAVEFFAEGMSPDFAREALRGRFGSCRKSKSRSRTSGFHENGGVLGLSAISFSQAAFPPPATKLKSCAGGVATGALRPGGDTSSAAFQLRGGTTLAS